MAKHPIGFKPSWPRLVVKPGERPRTDPPQRKLVDAIGSDFYTPDETDGMESPDADGDED